MKTSIPAIKPVTNDAEHKAVLAVFEAFVDRHAACSAGSPEAAYIDAQGTILAAYEKRRWPIPREWGADWDPVDFIREFAAERGITQRELAACFGSQPRCSAVLNRRRGLTLPMIRKLHAVFGIPAEILIRDIRRSAAYPETPSPGLAVADKE